MTEATSPAKNGPLADASNLPGDLAQAGREAFARRSWEEAFELLSQADTQHGLSAADLETLAEAAFFAAKAEQRPAIQERAFKAHEAAGDRGRAAYVALDLAQTLVIRGKQSLASAWTRRAERLLESWVG